MVSGGASQPLLVGHKCVTGGAQAIKLGHTYINEVGHRPHPRAASAYGPNLTTYIGFVLSIKLSSFIMKPLYY